jgi:hypothetical protein
VPREFVECLAFGIVFAGDNRQMFRQRDTTLLFELDGWPLVSASGQNRPVESE